MWVNCKYISYGVNSLRFKGLQLTYVYAFILLTNEKIIVFMNIKYFYHRIFMRMNKYKEYSFLYLNANNRFKLLNIQT